MCLIRICNLPLVAYWRSISELVPGGSLLWVPTLIQREASFALVLLDHDGCGSTEAREVIETAVEKRLALSGWANRCKVVVIQPELENWVWSKSPHVAKALGWKPDEMQLWLTNSGHWPEVSAKPPHPKEVVEAALRLKGIPRSSSIYHEIATKVSFDQCTDPAFVKLRTTLATWFPGPVG